MNLTFYCFQKKATYIKNLTYCFQKKATYTINLTFYCFQKKATYIKNASRIVHTEYDNDIPNTVEGLTSLPGIGPKVCLLNYLASGQRFVYLITWHRAKGLFT